jgi:hypothetical protein
MAQLIVRKLEKEVVQELKKRAAESGVSMEEAHRRILREELLKASKPTMTFEEFLVAPPYWDDKFIKLVNERKRDKARPVNLK